MDYDSFPIMLAIMDLDNFKLVNDIKGHLSGDELLSAFGKILNRHCDNENRKYVPAWKCFSFCVFFQHRRHVKFFIRPGRIDDFPDNGKSHKGHCRNKYCAPEPWIFVRKQHKKIERIHAEYKCCQHMVQTRHTVRPFRIAPKRLCNFDILFFCHSKKSFPSR